MNKKFTVIMIVTILFLLGILGASIISHPKILEVKKTIHQNTDQPEDAPFRHM